MKKLLLTLVAVAGILFGVASAATAQDRKPIRIGFQTGDINVILMYAMNAKLFDKEGLAVTTTPFPAGPAMLPALAAGEIDIAWMGEFPAVTGYSNGLPLEILFMERLDLTNVRLVVNPDCGVKALSDLRGKKIGVAIGSTSHYHLLRALSQGGLKAENVTLVNLTPANMPAAYIAKQIDAAFVWEPNVGVMERAGAKAIATTKSLGMITGGVWVARKPFVAEGGETVRRFLKAWDQGQAAYASNPKATRQYEAARVAMAAEAFDKLIEGQSAAHPSFKQLLTADFMGAPGAEMDSRLMKHLQGIAAFLVEEKRIQAVPQNWPGLFNTKPIQAYLTQGQK